MDIFYINNGSGLGTAKSGGTARHIEIAKRFIDWGLGVSIMATSGALSLYRAEGLAAPFHEVRASLWKKAERGHAGRAWSYIVSTVHALAIMRKMPEAQIVYSPSDYFCDVIPAWYCKRLHPERKFVVMVHHLCRSPLARKGKFFANLFSYAIQRMSYRFIIRSADHLLVYDTPEGEGIGDYFTRRGFPKEKISPAWNGINYAKIQGIPGPEEKRYDACFAGGLRGSKGIYDIVPAWKKVCKEFPQASLAVAGAGPKKVTEELAKAIRSAGLEDNVYLLGSLSPEKLYGLLKESKLFLSLSREEGWGISVCEALAAGLPVVAYSLPAFGIFKEHINEVLLGDQERFSQQVMALLRDQGERTRQGREGRKFIQKYDWEPIAQREKEILEG